MGLSSKALAIETSGPSCSVQKTDGGRSSSQCSQGPVTTIEEAKEKAWMFAPVVKFHPLEKYYIESMPSWYNASTLEKENGLKKEYRTKLSGGNDEAELSGAPFDDTGASTADIYYTVQEYDGNYWLYNFDLFFSWNGCSNQEFVLGSQHLRYLMCPAGVHETDLERLSVLVCKSDLNTIRRIGYNQHSWSEVRDCDKTESSCPRDSVTGNPVVYTALESHALYPENDGFHVYYNLGPLYVGDRTGDDVNRFFIPTKMNVKYLPSLETLPTSAEWEWAQFAGNWGKLIEAGPVTLKCISDDQSSYIECADSSAISLITSVAGTQELSKPLSEQVMWGPLFRPANYQIKGTEVAPIVESGVTTLTCPDDLAQPRESLGDSNAGSGSNATESTENEQQTTNISFPPAPAIKDTIVPDQQLAKAPAPTVSNVPSIDEKEDVPDRLLGNSANILTMQLSLLSLCVLLA